MISTLQTPATIQLANLIVNSFKLVTKESLFETGSLSKTEIASKLFQFPFAVLAHNTLQDPVFIYGNVKALSTFEYSWEEFTTLPSRLSAETINQADRQKLLDEAKEKGFVTSYEGFRISKTGKRFYIKNVILWNLIDENGINHGQAAVIYG